MDITDYVTREGNGETDTFEWGEITWLDGDDRTAGTGLTVGRVTFNPGGANATHRHPNCEESLYVLSGSLDHAIGDERTILEPRDLLHIPAGEPHKATNVSDEDEAVAMIAYDTADRRVEFVD